MSEVIDIGYNVSRLETSSAESPISQIVCEIPYKDSQIIGTNTGSSIIVNCDFGEGIDRNAIYNAIAGWVYTPYEAQGASIDPDVELGDSITIGGTSSGIYNMTVNYGALTTADLNASTDTEAEHEYSYQAAKDRSTSRQISSINGTVGGLSLTVGNLQEEYDDLYTGFDEVRIASENAVEASATATAAAADAVSQTQNKVTITELEDGTELKTATAVMNAAVGDVRSNIGTYVVSTTDSSGVTTTKSIADISADVVQVKGRVDLSGVAYVNTEQGQQSSGLGVRGSIVNSGNITTGGNLNLVNSNATINIGYDAYSPTEIAFALDPTTKQKLTDFWVLGK